MERFPGVLRGPLVGDRRSDCRGSVRQGGARSGKRTRGRRGGLGELNNAARSRGGELDAPTSGVVDGEPDEVDLSVEPGARDGAEVNEGGSGAGEEPEVAKPIVEVRRNGAEQDGGTDGEVGRDSERDGARVAEAGRTAGQMHSGGAGAVEQRGQRRLAGALVSRRARARKEAVIGEGVGTARGRQTATFALNAGRVDGLGLDGGRRRGAAHSIGRRSAAGRAHPRVG